MKNKLDLILSFLLISFLASFTFAQETKVSTVFTVIDENKNFFADLKATDIQILQNKTPLAADSLVKTTDQNLDVIFMVDASMSQERVLPLVKKIVQGFIASNLKNTKDRAGIVEFTGEVKILQPLTADFAAANEKLNQIEIKPAKDNLTKLIFIGNLPPRLPKRDPNMKQSATSLFDSVKEVAQNVFANERKDSRKVIILMTDGVDTFSESKKKETIVALVKTKIPIYAIGIGDSLYGGVDKKTLKEITKSTGGQVFTPNKTDDLTEIFKEIEQSLRANYTGFFTLPAAPQTTDKLQEIKIEIINPELRKRKLSVLQNRGYFSKQ